MSSVEGCLNREAKEVWKGFGGGRGGGCSCPSEKELRLLAFGGSRDPGFQNSKKGGAPRVQDIRGRTAPVAVLTFAGCFCAGA
jgi:hypothetical protein